MNQRVSFSSGLLEFRGGFKDAELFTCSTFEALVPQPASCKPTLDPKFRNPKPTKKTPKAGSWQSGRIHPTPLQAAEKLRNPQQGPNHLGVFFAL